MKVYHFLHPELMSPEAPVVIMAKINNLEELKEQKYKLVEQCNELDKRIKAEEAELDTIKGALFECVEDIEMREESKPKAHVKIYVNNVLEKEY